MAWCKYQSSFYIWIFDILWSANFTFNLLKKIIMTEISIVRQNLIKDINYRPYCGNALKNACYNPRTEYRSIDSQFICPNCKWISKFPDYFIKRYKKIHNL